MKFRKSCNLMQSAENIFWQYIKIKNFLKYIWAVFPIRKEKLREPSFKIISSKFKWQNFFKNLKSSIVNLFLNSMAFDFYKFLATCKKSEKSIYISDEVVHCQAARKRDDQTEWTFHRTTTLHATPHYKLPHFAEPPHNIKL